MKVPLIDLKPQHRMIRREIDISFRKIFDSQKFILGDYGKALEEAVCRKTGVRHAVGLASGSDALYLALAALGVGPGDEVITTPFSFFATAGSISRVGAKPVFADIDPVTFNLDPAQVAKKITRRTKALVPVHLFGLCADMGSMMTLGRNHGLAVVEDAAQSFGASWNGRSAGSIGDAGCYSFYPTKNLGGSGDGGMLVTSSDKIAKKVRLLRDHGASQKYVHECIGINSRLDELQAATILVKLKHIDRWNQARSKHVAQYAKLLGDTPLTLPTVVAGQNHVYHLYSVLTERRESLKEHLLKNGIGCGVYYPLPLHLQPCYKSMGYRKGDMATTEKVAQEVLSIPMYAEMTDGQIDHVAQKIKQFFKS